MAPITIYTTKQCPYCIRAKTLLEQKGISFHEISVDNDPKKRAEMQRLSGGYTVPQIFINQTPIGGCSDLMALEDAGKLDVLLGIN